MKTKRPNLSLSAMGAERIIFERRPSLFSTQTHHSLLRALECDCLRGQRASLKEHRPNLSLDLCHG